MPYKAMHIGEWREQGVATLSPGGSLKGCGEGRTTDVLTRSARLAHHDAQS